MLVYLKVCPPGRVDRFSSGGVDVGGCPVLNPAIELRLLILMYNIVSVQLAHGIEP
jgi:hypothetical protein